MKLIRRHREAPTGAVAISSSSRLLRRSAPRNDHKGTPGDLLVLVSFPKTSAASLNDWITDFCER
jgi:hypothetical protein